MAVRRSRRRLLRVVAPTVFSGAVGTAQDTRSQLQNKRLAFTRMANSQKFQLWLKMEIAARMQGYVSAERRVDELMRDENIKIEYGVV